MSTEADLRASLSAHAADMPQIDDRLLKVRHRLQVARRRRVAGAGVVAVVIALVAVLVPVTTRSTGTQRITPTVSQPPWPTYAAGGRALAGTQLTSAPDHASQSFSFTPTSYLLVLRVSCTGSSPDTVEITLNGAASSFSGGCGSATGTTADAAAGARQWAPFIHLGRVNTVTVTRQAGAPGSSQAASQPVPGPAITVVIYQGVPFADYPLPPKPSAVPRLAPDATQSVGLDSRKVGATGTFTTQATVVADAPIHGPAQSRDVVAVGPGTVDVAIDRHHVQTAGFYDWTDGSDMVGLTPPELASYGVHVAVGQRVTVTVTAAHFTGPYWLISVG